MPENDFIAKKSEFDQFFGAKAVFGSQTLLNQLSYVKIVGL